jgi:hypothetical protein
VKKERSAIRRTHPARDRFVRALDAAGEILAGRDAVERVRRRVQLELVVAARAHRDPVHAQEARVIGAEPAQLQSQARQLQ